jgi:hypothetical protein
MTRLLAILACLSTAFCPAVFAAELTDLGSGLSYLRVHSVTGEEYVLRKAVPAAGALVLDLRYATAGDTSPAALRAALADRSNSAPLFVLVGPDTPAILTPIIGATRALTLGIAGTNPAPKVVVQAEAAADRRAYDALETGTPISQLITGKIEKERFDEASLVNEFKHGNPEAAPPPAPDPTAPRPSATSAKPETIPPTDRVLQRAVHLHRALLALKVR